SALPRVPRRRGADAEVVTAPLSRMCAVRRERGGQGARGRPVSWNAVPGQKGGRSAVVGRVPRGTEPCRVATTPPSGQVVWRRPVGEVHSRCPLRPRLWADADADAEADAGVGVVGLLPGVPGRLPGGGLCRTVQPAWCLSTWWWRHRWARLSAPVVPPSAHAVE